jgi:hypothetical protein
MRQNSHNFSPQQSALHAIVLNNGRICVQNYREEVLANPSVQ